MAVTSNTELLVPKGTKLYVKKGDTYGNLPDSVATTVDAQLIAAGWRDLGYLANVATSSADQNRDVQAVGFRDPIAILLGARSKSLTFGLTSHDPRNVALAAGGGEYVDDPGGRANWVQFREAASPAMVSFFLHYSNAQPIDVLGAMFYPQMSHYFPCAQVLSQSDFDGGPAGSGQETTIAVTARVLAPPANATHNPDALPVLPYTDHPTAVGLAGAGVVV